MLPRPPSTVSDHSCELMSAGFKRMAAVAARPSANAAAIAPARTPLMLLDSLGLMRGAAASSAGASGIVLLAIGNLLGLLV